MVEAFGFMNKLTDVNLFLDYALSAMEEPIVRDKALLKRMKGIPELLRDGRLIAKESHSEAELKTFAESAEERIKESYLNKFNRSKVTVLNLSLVMICTVLELFFEHILSLIFEAKPETLLTISRERNISLEQFLKSSTYDDVLKSFINKTTEQITRQGTMDILSVFDRIGVRKDMIFSWINYTDEAQGRFAGWNGEKLKSIFEERHSIVHEYKSPLLSVEELLIRNEFFMKIILNISILVGNKFYKHGIILDSQDQIRKATKK